MRLRRRSRWAYLPLTVMTSQPDLFSPLDAETTEVVRAVDADWRRAADRDAIDSAVRRVAAANGGMVSTNAVRRELTSRYGTGYVVCPQAIGPRLAALTRAGVLEVVGWDTSDDVAGRNAGKPQKVRRWVGAA